ncbi:MAG TPA: nucleoside triphosphate pyrophosphohydrolase [Candidatus Sulfotelmatobacter sp.]|jgi:tetrapyrrole methylase family protein/MazG family protein|nr:nucleoside triphosphate pyrophosphohydrolase [Candidatus Sulfotelmatobacter sp.]
MKKAKKSGKRAPKKQAARRKMKADAAGKWFEKLVILQAKLRAPDGCPWDREQTHMTLRTYLIEEAYEVLEALESGDDVKFAEELGDLLLQVVFHAEIARDQGRFDVAGVIEGIHEKMVRRHPHVFGEKRAKDAKAVLKNWERIKAEERKAKGAAEIAKPASLLDGVSHALPGTMEGFQLTRRASRIGFDWDCADGVLEKLAEETGELKKEVAGADAGRIEEETGDLLFAAVNLARFLHVDPEIALKKANAKFAARFRDMERMAREGGKELADVPRAEMETLWERAKKTESRQSTGAAR